MAAMVDTQENFAFLLSYQHNVTLLFSPLRLLWPSCVKQPLNGWRC